MATAVALGYVCMAADAATAAMDTRLCHLIGSISCDVIGWTRSIRVCQSTRPLCINTG